MADTFKVFGLLIYKNLLIRKRHWIMTLILQTIVPFLFFILIQLLRDYTASKPVEIKNATIPDKYSKEDLMEGINLWSTNLYYTPNNTHVEGIMENARKCLGLPAEQVIGVRNEADLIDAYAAVEIESITSQVFAFVFEKYDTPSIKYKLRHNKVLQSELYQFNDNAKYPHELYIKIFPFVQMQICVDEALINKTAKTPPVFKTFMQHMPYPPYTQIDIVDMTIRKIMPGLIVSIILIPLCIEANLAAKEKFVGVNALMGINGVHVYQSLLSWLITGVIFSSLYVLPATILYNFTLTGNVNPFLFYSNSFIFWLVFTVHVTHLISYGMHIAAYFTKPRFVIISIVVVYHASSLLLGTLVKEQIFFIIPFLGILFPNFLLYRFFEEVNAYEIRSIGIHWCNMFVPSDMQYNFSGSIGFILIFSALGILLHFVLAVYVNAVLPGKYGARKHPLYFLKFMKTNKISLDEEACDIDYGAINDENFEPVGQGTLVPGIEIRGLKKTYRSGLLQRTEVDALKGISMDMYKGQITALLGHNGAGKTTLMSILTGITSASKGTVYVNGKNIRTDLDDIRNDLGLCPQENMVFADLTVYEHLQFFGMLKSKNKSRDEIKHLINLLLAKLKIADKKNVLPSKLSGGQKRRLCLGMALIGNASIVILDEPTSGMDPETRRDTWDILLKMRGEKTILITTHNMEEADILGDRIAIVHGGRLKSYGTSMFLKKRYGHGCMEVTLSTKSWCDADKVLAKFDPRTQKISVDKEKILLSVPYSDSLPRSLDTVEAEKSQLGVTGMSASLITLEEVFLKTVRNEEESPRLNEVFNSPLQKVEGFQLSLLRMLTLFQKKIAHTRKNLGTVLYIVLLPILPVLLMSLNDMPPSQSVEVFPLRMDLYRNPKALYEAGSNRIAEFYKASVKYFYGVAETVASGVPVIQGLLTAATRDLTEYRNNIIAAADFSLSDNATYATAYYSTNAIHSSPISVNLMSNALIKAASGEEYSIEISRQQLAKNAFLETDPWVYREAGERSILFCCFFFTTVALFVSHPLQEMTTKVKQLQRMTGVSGFSYWATMFIIDLIVFILAIGTMMLSFYLLDRIIDVRMYRGKEISILALMFLLFGINTLAIAYIFSFINRSRNTVVTILSISPFGLVIIYYIARDVLMAFPKLKLLHDILTNVFPVIPYISFFAGQTSFLEVALRNARCRRLPNALREVVCSKGDYCCEMDCTDGECKNPDPYFTSNDESMNLGTCFIYLAASPLLYFAILFVLEQRLIPKLFTRMLSSKLRNPCETYDEEVKREKHTVAMEINKINSRGAESEKTISTSQSDLLPQSDNESNNLFLVYELSKYYGKLMAVREISFRVKQRECFGLLGVNGAGKSTTFRMLTGEEIPNSGSMYLGQSEIRADRTNYLSEMGYCPQTDALLNSLNSFDHLRLFAGLRGVPKSKIDLEVNKWINRLNLNACMFQPSGTYSGGNKRRLNIAMSLIGNPKLVLLDEPTTGVDPAARRSLWTTLQACQAAGQAIILTSHSMEECEALCNRLVIMVRGQLVCVGASQELKQRFGVGFNIQIKLYPNRSEQDVENIKRAMTSSLTCQLTDENMGYIAYHVMDSRTTWEKMFSTMKDLKAQYECIEDYAVLSATLEQLFIQFARGAELPVTEETVMHTN